MGPPAAGLLLYPADRRRTGDQRLTPTTGGLKLEIIRDKPEGHRSQKRKERLPAWPRVRIEMKSQTVEKLLRLQREVGQAIYRDKRHTGVQIP